MSICDPIEYDYARALEEHQAKEIRPQCKWRRFDRGRCALDFDHAGPCDFDPYGTEAEGDEG